MRASSKDCLIVSGLYCLARGIQSNDLPPTQSSVALSNEDPFISPRAIFHQATVRVYVCVQYVGIALQTHIHEH